MPHIRNSFIVLLIFLNSLIIYTQEIQEEVVVTGSFTKEIQASNPIFSSSIDDINKRGNIFQCNQDIDETFKNIITNNDYLMIKGSNATGLNTISKEMIKGNNVI